MWITHTDNYIVLVPSSDFSPFKELATSYP